jgi:hypothetical protein
MSAVFVNGLKDLRFPDKKRNGGVTNRENREGPGRKSDPRLMQPGIETAETRTQSSCRDLAKMPH